MVVQPGLCWPDLENLMGLKSESSHLYAPPPSETLTLLWEWVVDSQANVRGQYYFSIVPEAEVPGWRFNTGILTPVRFSVAYCRAKRSVAYISYLFSTGQGIYQDSEKSRAFP